MSESLDALGLKYGTDKSSSHHDYLRFYETFMAPLRASSITILEIGVYQGASLQMWRDYFPNARIVGVDIVPACKALESERVHIEIADQSNLEHLAALALEHGPFDIIIEDGSHMWDHQITSLRALFPFLRSGGYYVVEDLQTNYGALQSKYQGVSAQNCVDFLKNWLDICVADDVIDIDSLKDPFLRTYGRAIESMIFQRRCCALRKWFPPLSEPADGRSRVTIQAHVGMLGDIVGTNKVDEEDDRYTIQGLSIKTELRALQYRVRFPDGTWSDWVHEGVFVGTRGKSLAITGFSARLGEAGRLEVRGLFVGGVSVDVSEGQECIAPNDAPLRGLQIVLRSL